MKERKTMEDAERETHKWGPRSSGCVIVTVQEDISSAQRCTHIFIYPQNNSVRPGWGTEEGRAQRGQVT